MNRDERLTLLVTQEWRQKVFRLRSALSDAQSELKFWSGSKHEGDCDLSGVGCSKCSKARVEHWQKTDDLITRIDALISGPHP